MKLIVAEKSSFFIVRIQKLVYFSEHVIECNRNTIVIAKKVISKKKSHYKKVLDGH